MLPRIFIILLVSFGCVCLLHAQTKTVVQNPLFQASGQSMWGGGSAPGLNKNFEIFPEYSVNLPFNTGSFTKLSFQGLDFGAVLDGHVAFGVGPFEFDISGFTLGEIDVNYPAVVRLEMPDDNTFNRGETITIRSSFQAAPGAELITTYPQAGSIGLYMGIMFDARFGVQACFIDCTPRLSILPPGDPNLFPSPLVDQTFTFFEVSQDGLIYICDNTSNPIEFAENPFQCEFNTGFPPWTVSQGAFSGTMDIPHVETTSTVINNTNLRAEGADPYVIPSIDIIELLGYIPPVRTATSIIQGSFRIDVAPDVTGTMRGITIDWSLLRTALNLPIRQSQRFDFEPRIFTTLTFPDTVDYVVHSRRSGNQPGRGTDIQYEVGDSVSLRFPCQYDFMDVSAKHSIKNKFTNKTFDNFAIELDFDALDFGLTIDPYLIVPRICIPIPFASDICIGPVGFPGFSLDPPPLIDPDPITLISQDFPPYFQDSWELGGFNEAQIATPFRLQPRPRQVDIVAQHVSCHGDSTGAITTTVSGGSSPLQYEWSFGSSEPDPINVPAGQHYLKLTDVNNCVSFEAVSISQPPAIDAAITATPILCNGGEATLLASASGGTGEPSFLWNTGETTPGVSGKTAGNYSVIVTDERGCEKTVSSTLHEPTALKVQISNAVNPTCTNAADGSLTVFVEGGTAPYQFQWSTHSSQRDQQHLPAGTYTVTVTDGNGCAASDSRTLEDPPQLDVTLTRQSDVLCFGGSDGALQATVEGGTPPYQYKWYNNLLTLSHRGAHATGLAQGSYSVAVTDSKGCTQTRSLNIRQPVQPLQADLTTMPALCNNEASGSIDLTVRGGKPPYQYSWSSGHSSEDLNNVHAGEYEVTVTDANGCTYTNKTRVVDPEPLRVSLMPSDVSCADQQDGSIKILGVFGGYPPFAFQWSNGETGEGIDGLAEGTYSVTIRDASGCEVTESRTIYTNEDDCLFIPNTFSPNGDGINDTWNIRNIQLYARATVRVYNRWGLSVFESQGYSQPWDGTYKGKDLEPSTYYYLVDLGNGTPVYQGYLIIVR